MCEDVLDPDDLLGNLDELFTEDPAGRSSGYSAVAKPVPKKERSKVKGDALSAMPVAELDDGESDVADLDEEDDSDSADLD